MARGREHEGPLPITLAYFLTWTTYGTWLPGDERGWVEHGTGWHNPDPIRCLEAQARMEERACRLDRKQRATVEAQIEETCQFRGWELHTVNCRSNHAHVIVTAEAPPKAVRNQLKAWSTRRLKELEVQRRILARSVSEAECGVPVDAKSPIRVNWWSERGSHRFINDLASLEAAIRYVRDGQDGFREM